MIIDKHVLLYVQVIVWQIRLSLAMFGWWNLTLLIAVDRTLGVDCVTVAKTQIKDHVNHSRNQKGNFI